MAGGLRLHQVQASDQVFRIHACIREKMAPDSTPVAEETTKKIFSIPMHLALIDTDLKNIVASVEKVTSHYSR